MSAASWQVTATPYHGSLGRTSGAAYGSFFKPTGTATADTGNYGARTLTSIPAKVFTGFEPGPRSEKYAQVSASDIKKIVDAALSSKGPDKGYVPVASDLGRTVTRDESGLLFTDNFNRSFQPGHTRQNDTTSGYSLLDSSTTLTGSRPYSSNIAIRSTQRDGLNNSLTKLDRSNTTLGISSGTSLEKSQAKDTLSDRRPLTPYHGYDNLVSSSSAISGHDVAPKATNAELALASSVTSTKYISEKANYNTHQRYSEENKLLSYSSYRNSQAQGLKDSYVARTTSGDLDLDNSKYTSGNDSKLGYASIGPSYRLYSARTKSYLDQNNIPSSENPSPAETSVSSNASRYLDSLGPRLHTPAPPRTPFPCRQDVVLAKNDVLESQQRVSSIVDQYGDDLSSKTLATPMNNVHMNTSLKTTSPRDKYTASATINGLLGSDVYNSNHRELGAILADPASIPLPISATSGKRSILKRVSSYGGPLDTYPTRTFSGINPRDIPLLNGFRNEKLPPLSHMSTGYTKRSGSGQRVTFNFNQNTHHCYEAAIYDKDEHYVSPYLWL